MLLGLEDIKKGLLTRFGESGMDELLLRNSQMSQSRIERLENEIGRPLPVTFRKLILKYDFGSLDWRIFFGTGGDYVDWLLQNNGRRVSPAWWGNGERPVEFLFVAATDAYVVLLNLNNGCVFAFMRDENWKNNTLIAKDFELFVRGAGTLLLRDEKTNEKDLADNVKTEVGADARSTFWGGY